MLLFIAAVLFILWILGMIGNIASGFIYILLIAAIALAIWHFVAGRRTTV